MAKVTIYCINDIMNVIMYGKAHNLLLWIAL